MKVKTSEEIVCISPQPPAMCGLIDTAIRMVRDGEPFQLIESQLEIIRRGIEDLRGWGQDWKEEAIRQIQTTDPEQHQAILEARAARKDAD